MTFEPIVAALVANFITKYVKPSKVGMTEYQMDARKSLVRVINAGLGIIALVATVLLTGGELDVTALSTYVEVVVTFLVGQAMYFLAKTS